MARHKEANKKLGQSGKQSYSKRTCVKYVTKSKSKKKSKFILKDANKTKYLDVDHVAKGCRVDWFELSSCSFEYEVTSSNHPSFELHLVFSLNSFGLHEH